MKTLSSVLLCTALALASATPWYSNPYKARAQKAGYFDSRGYYHPEAETAMTHETFSAARTQQQVTPGLNICQSATYVSGRVSTYIHVCQNNIIESEYCYFTDGACCREPVLAPPISHYELKLNQLTVNVKYYSAFGAQGACFLLDQRDLEACGGCTPLRCTDSRCSQNAISCTSDTCVCKDGYAPPDCCQCDVKGVTGQRYYKDPVTKDCKRVCKHCVELTIDGCTRCEAGFTGRDCCQCDGIVIGGVCKPVCTKNTLYGDIRRSCSEDLETCQCKMGYAPPDCCVCKHCIEPTINGCTRCENGFSGRDCCQCDNIVVDGVCKQACLKNTVAGDASSCSRGKCTCRSPFTGDDCCTGCVTEQDIHFIFDSTKNNNRRAFCETHYGTELLLSALDPGASISGTRVEALLYPKPENDNRNEERNATTLFGLGTGCTEAIGETLNLVDGFYDPQDATQKSPLLEQVRGNLAYPATPLKSIRERIVSAKTNRQRVVILVTDGESDERTDTQAQIDSNPNTTEEAEALRNIPQLTLIVAGNDVDFQNGARKRYRRFLNKVASGSETDTENAVIESNPFDLMIGIANRMAAVGAICETQRKEVVDQIKEVQKNTKPNTPTPQCRCIQRRKPLDNKNSCRVPPEIRCQKDESSNNTYYVGSPNYQQPRSMATLERDFKNSKNSQLEQEILQAVEEVLEGRLDIK